MADALSLPPLLERVKRAATQQATAALRESGFAGVSPRHGAVLRFTDDAGSRPSEVAARCGLTAQHVGQVAVDLQRLGLAELAADPSDGRARIVTLTARGRAARDAAALAVAGVERDWERRHGRARIRELRATLERIADGDG